MTDGDQAFPPTLRPALNPLSIIMGMVSRCIETAIFSLWSVWWPVSVNLWSLFDTFRVEARFVNLVPRPLLSRHSVDHYFSLATLSVIHKSSKGFFYYQLLIFMSPIWYRNTLHTSITWMINIFPNRKDQNILQWKSNIAVDILQMWSLADSVCINQNESGLCLTLSSLDKKATFSFQKATRIS